MAEIVESDLVLRDRFSRVLGKFKRATTAAFRNSERRASRAIRAFTAFRGSIAGSIGALISLKGAIAAAGIGFLTKRLVTLATTQEDAVNRLNAALKTTGQFSDETSASIQRLASAFQTQTTFGDEAVLGLQALLITYGVMTDQIEEATQVTLDFAVATGRDLNTAALTVGKAAAGFTGELSRYGIIIDKNIPKTQKFRAVLDKMNQQFSGAAQAATRTFSGRMAQLGNAIGDIGEQLGFMIIESETLRTVISELSILTSALAGAMNDLRGSTDDTKKSLSELVLSAESLLETLQFGRRLLAIVTLIFQTLTGVVLGLIFALEALTDALGITDDAFNTAELAINELTKDMQKNVDIVQGMDPVYLKASARIREFREEQRKLQVQVIATSDALEQRQIKAAGKVSKAIDELLKPDTRILLKELKRFFAVDLKVELELAAFEIRKQAEAVAQELGGVGSRTRDRLLALIPELRGSVEEQIKQLRIFIQLAKSEGIEAIEALSIVSTGFQTQSADAVLAFQESLNRQFEIEKKILGGREAENRRTNRALIFGATATAKTILNLAETFGGESVAIRKAAAVAEAVINTSVAITRALAEGGPFAGPILAGVMAAIGAAQIATILAASPGARGAVSAPAGGGAMAPIGPSVAEAAPAPGPREITINISGFVGDEALLIDEIARISREAVGDNIDFGTRVSR